MLLSPERFSTAVAAAPKNNRDVIHLADMNGADAGLVALLASAAPQAAAQAAWALSCLAKTDTPQSAIFAAGGFRPLLRLLIDPSDATAGHAAEAVNGVTNLMRAADQVTMPEGLEAMAVAVQRRDTRLRNGALFALAHVGTVAYMPSIERLANLDALLTLVRSFREPDCGAIYEVTATVCNVVNFSLNPSFFGGTMLSNHPRAPAWQSWQAVHDRIVTTGAVPWLVQLLSHPTTDVAGVAAGALSGMAYPNAANAAVIVAAGAAPALKVLMQRPDARYKAAAAAGSIAQGNGALIGALASAVVLPPLVVLLTPAPGRAKVLNGAASAVGNIAGLCSDSVKRQLLALRLRGEADGAVPAVGVRRGRVQRSVQRNAARGDISVFPEVAANLAAIVPMLDDSNPRVAAAAARTVAFCVSTWDMYKEGVCRSLMTPL